MFRGQKVLFTIPDIPEITLEGEIRHIDGTTVLVELLSGTTILLPHKNVKINPKYPDQDKLLGGVA